MEAETRTDERPQALRTTPQLPASRHLTATVVTGMDEELHPATRLSASPLCRAVRAHTRTNRRLVSVLLAAVVSIAGSLAPLGAVAAERPDSKIFGVRLRLGWKYDDVRMCAATGPGAPHGPDIDISAFTELALWDDARIDVNLPILRPIMFAAGAKMLQFEPEATLLFRRDTSSGTQLVAGPSVGVSLHYGPDYDSDPEGSGRTASFWAVGPRVGGYVGLDFARPGEAFNFQLGLHPYVAPLISINDERHHRGWVMGITLENSFRLQSNPGASGDQ